MMSNPQEGTWEGKAKRLQNKSNDHAIKTMSNKMWRRDANQACRAIWAAQMTYSLPVTSMTSEQLENIEKSQKSKLGKTGIQSKISGSGGIWWSKHHREFENG